MEKAARVFNWLGYIGILVTFLVLGIEYTSLANTYDCSNYYSYSCSKVLYNYYNGLSITMWALLGIYVLVMLPVSIWIDNQITSRGNVVAAGIVSILFLGIIGGILTVCCQSLYDASTSYSSRNYGRDNSEEKQHYSFKVEEKPSSPSFSFKAGEKYKLAKNVYTPYGLVYKGSEVTITEITSAFCMADVVLENGQKANVNLMYSDLEEPIQNEEPVNSSSEMETIKILKEYKSLLDNGVITQEEFDKKKKELL